MANVDGPRGFMPWTQPGGNVSCELLTIDVGNASAMFIGDLMVKEADGSIAAATAGAGNYVDGAILALYDTNMVPVSSLATTTVGFALCATDPEQRFIAQDDGTVTQLALADRGTNVDMINTHGGSTFNYRSGMEIDSSTTAAGATGQLRLLQLAPVQGNAIGANAKWIVKINYHHAVQGTVGAEV